MGRLKYYVLSGIAVAVLSYTGGYGAAPYLNENPYFENTYVFLAKTLAGVVAKVKSLDRRVSDLEERVNKLERSGVSVKALTYCRVNASWLRIRKEPGLMYPTIGYFRRGMKVPVFDEKNGWYKTIGGYINNKYCEVER